MKYFTLILGMMILSSCNSSQKFDYYQGYIYSTKHKPIENIELYQWYETIKIIDKTNKEGFFKIKGSETRVSRSLILKYENKIIGSVQIIRTHPEFGPKFFFVEGRSDTLFIDMQKREEAYERLDKKR